jgi:DNA (cytosine-5)-methyltransferase 1
MNFIDLFAGAGGLSEGFIRAGFTPVAHVENDVCACFTLKTRAAFYYLKTNNQINIYKDYLTGKIDRTTLYESVPSEVFKNIINLPISVQGNKRIFDKIDSFLKNKKVDLIIGGPPCQAYSIPGRSRDKNNMKDDPRNYLYKGYANFLKKYTPKIFLFENVEGLISAKYDNADSKSNKSKTNYNQQNGSYLKNMLALFKRSGYNVEYKVLNAQNFGVLQDRNRVIIIGWRKGTSFLYPEFDTVNHPYYVSDLLQDLPKIKAGKGKDKGDVYISGSSDYLNDFGIKNGIDILTQHVSRPHIKRDLEIYRNVVRKWNKSQKRLKYNELNKRLITHKNIISHLDRYKVVGGNLKYCQTVVAHISKDGHHFIHPDLKQNRSLTVREAARLQSFPDDFYFEGIKEGKNRTAAFKQIGNAVPPLMANSIARKIKSLL